MTAEIQYWTGSGYTSIKSVAQGMNQATADAAFVWSGGEYVQVWPTSTPFVMQGMKFSGAKSSGPVIKLFPFTALYSGSVVSDSSLIISGGGAVKVTFYSRAAVNSPNVQVRVNGSIWWQVPYEKNNNFQTHVYYGNINNGDSVEVWYGMIHFVSVELTFEQA